MTEHKFTDEEIIKALKSCKESACLVCPYNVVYAVCRDVMCGDALDLINRLKSKNADLQDGAKCEKETNEHLSNEYLVLMKECDSQKAEIERLREKQTEDEKLLNDRVIESVNAVSKAHLKYENALEEQIKTVKAEAVKEFAKYLKKYYRHIDKTVGALIEYHIDEIVKEMLEGG
jgi:hypothetical protein